MALSHRKLFTDPIYAEKTEFCKPYCDPIKNSQGLCPFPCFSICTSNCYHKILPQIPPPPELITSTVDPPHHHHIKFSAPLIVFLFILVTLFSLFLCFTIFKCFIACYRCRSRQRSSLQTDLEETHDEFLDEDHGPVLDHPIWYIRTIGLQPSVINAITICKYKRGEGLVEGTECSVCLNEFQEDETLRLLPKCNHALHIPCIDTWLRSHTNCPLCRAGIVANVAGLPALEQNIDNSNVLEDTQVEILLNNGENGRGIEEGTSELRVYIEEEGALEIENGIKSNEIDKEELGNIDQFELHDVQLMRRSASMDFLSAGPVEMNANPIHSDGNWDRRMVKANYLNMGFLPKMFDSSSGNSLQKESVLMKR